MEIGLTAKVKPEIDERESERQASKLKTKMEEAVSDLPATMDLDSVLDKTSQMKEDVEEMTSSLENVASVPMPDGGVVAAGGGAQAGPQMPDQGMGGFGGQDDQDAGPGGLQGKMAEMAQQQDGMLGRVGEMAGGIQEQNGLLGRIGKGLLAGAAAIAITGLALGYMRDTVEALSSTSPLLGQVVDMIGLAMSLFLRPIATTLGQFLLPLATGMLQLASEFNTVFQEQGIADALAFLSMEILAGLANMVLSVDVIGGLIDMGQFAVLGGDGDFGFADAIRLALIAAVGKMAIGKILSKGILSMLPRITAARVINWLVFPKLGTLIANRLGSTLMKASITEILEAGFRQLLQRAFGPVVAQASFKTLWQAAFRTLMSKIPSFGITAFLKRLVPSFGGGAAKAFLTRLIPKIGVSSLLKRLGLSAAIKLLTGRLAYFIPVVGQAIAIIDLLTMLITALIPGMEMFSPINWLLVQTWNLLKWIVGGLADLGGWIVGGIMDGFEWLANFNWGSLIPNISADGMMSFGGDILDAILGVLEGIWEWFLSSIQPVLDFLQPVFMLLAIFAALGMQFYEMMMKGWKKLKKWLGGMWESLKNLSFEDITSALGDMGGAAVEGAIDLANWVGGGIGDLADWVGDGLGSLADWVTGGLGRLTDWISGGANQLWTWMSSGTARLWSWLSQGTAQLWNWISRGSAQLWTWLSQGTAQLWTWLTRGTAQLWSWISSGTARLWNWVSSGTASLWTWLTEGASNLGQDLWDWLTAGATALGSTLWGWITAGFTAGANLFSWLTSGVSGVGQMLWDWMTEGAVNIGSWFSENVPSVSDITSSVADAVPSPNDITDAVADLIPDAPDPDINPVSDGNQDVGDYVPDVDPTGFQPGGVSLDPRDHLASGGIVTGPTTALIGEGSESEAVMPLSKLEQFISPPESAGRSGTTSATIDVNIDQGEDTSATDIADAISSAIGSQLESIEASIDELARTIKREGMVGDITITADGKIIAEVNEDGKDKYKRTREVNK